MTRRREPEPPVLIARTFAHHVFTTAQGVRLSWEALQVGMREINARHEAMPPRRVRPVQLQIGGVA